MIPTPGAIELARHFADGTSSAETVAATHIATIRTVNPGLNAVVAERFPASMRDKVVVFGNE